jgi:predicted RNA-binding Zn-ribbon protein involved in translation (DUF1610 family)
LICPACKSTDCRRSRRSGVSDHLLGAARLLPWKCRACEHRFHAWVVPPAFLLKAHCPKCGNLEIDRIARKRVEEGWLARLERALHFPAYRCDPCRHKFFSLRPLRPIRTVPAPLTGQQARAAEAAAKAEHSAKASSRPA